MLLLSADDPSRTLRQASAFDPWGRRRLRSDSHLLHLLNGDGLNGNYAVVEAQGLGEADTFCHPMLLRVGGWNGQI